MEEKLAPEKLHQLQSLEQAAKVAEKDYMLAKNNLQIAILMTFVEMGLPKDATFMPDGTIVLPNGPKNKD